MQLHFTVWKHYEKKDEIIILQPVHFAFDKDFVLPESTPLLNAIAKIMLDHPEIVMVMIEGHTDSVGTLEYNDDLSDRRVAFVRKYLIDTGIDAARLQSKGFGERVPLVLNTSAENRAKNRRVEFKI
jgi:outer membrane protein OmpA-like peptidoglycan-associated protein